MMPEWRSGGRSSLWARPIYEKDWPVLIEKMKDHGLFINIDDRIRFFYGEYEITAKEIARAWGLSSSQMKKLKDRIIRGEWDNGE
jgi:hypothetical protein